MTLPDGNVDGIIPGKVFALFIHFIILLFPDKNCAK